MEEKDLFFKYLSGDCDHQEKEAIDAQVKIDQELDKDFRKVDTLWELTKLEKHQLDDKIELSQVNSWDAIQDKLGWTDESEEVNSTEVKTFSIKSRQWLKVAAIITVVLGLSLIAFERTTSMLNESQNENISIVNNQKKGPKKVLLPDGTSVALNKGATISYSKNLVDAPNRTVSVSGEVYFDVKRNETQPFIIETSNGTSIKVLGTSFNVNTNEKETVVSVTSGKVAVDNEVSPQSVTLIKGQQAISTTSQLIKEEDYDINSLAWKTGKLVFEASDMDYVVNTLNSFYGVEMVLFNQQLEQCQITARFENQSVDEVIGILKDVLSAEISLEDQRYIIKGEGCN